jgi:hypothetical protein
MFFGLLKSKGPEGPPDVNYFSDSMGGSYDIAGDCLTGDIRNVRGLKNGSVWVQARRRGKIVANHLVPKAKGGRLHFKMPIEGRFTVEELGRDIVAINCVNSNGDAALLVLDGNTRLELIRQFMGIPVEPVLDLDFKRSGNAKAYLGLGWFPAEPEFTRTRGEESTILFTSPLPPGPFLLRMKYHSLISEFAPRQQLDCYINDHPVASFTEDNRKVNFREFRLSASVFHGADESVIRLEHPLAASPGRFEKGKDPRSVAFCFRAISIVRVLQAD